MAGKRDISETDDQGTGGGGYRTKLNPIASALVGNGSTQVSARHAGRRCSPSR